MTTRSRPGGASSGRASQSSYRAARPPAIRGRGSGLWAGSEQRSRSLAAARAQGTPPPPPACAARDCVGVTRAARGRCGGEPACPCPASSTPPRRPSVSARIPWCRGGREVHARPRLPEPRPVHVPVNGFVLRSDPAEKLSLGCTSLLTASASMPSGQASQSDANFNKRRYGDTCRQPFSSQLTPLWLMFRPVVTATDEKITKIDRSRLPT